MPTPVITSVTPVVHAGSKSKLVILGSGLPRNVRLVLVEPDDADVEISEPRWFSSSKVIFRLSSRLSSAEPQTLNFRLFSDGERLPMATGGNAFAVQMVPHPAVEKYRGARVLPWKLATILVGMILLSWLLSRPKTVEISASPAEIEAGKISEVMVEFSRPVDLENRHWFKLPADIQVWGKTILSPTQCLLKFKTSDVSQGKRIIYLQGMSGSLVLNVVPIPSSAASVTATTARQEKGNGWSWLWIITLIAIILFLLVLMRRRATQTPQSEKPAEELEKETDGYFSPVEDSGVTVTPAEMAAALSNPLPKWFAPTAITAGVLALAVLFWFFGDLILRSIFK